MAVAFCDPAYGVGCDLTPTVNAIASLLQAARPRGVPIVFTTIAFDPDAVAADAGMWGVKIPALLELRADDPNATTIDERIAVQPGETVINKKRSSAFFGTNLEGLLSGHQVDTLVLCGCSTSGCIRATALDGVSYGYRVVVPEECVADRAEGPHRANLFDIEAKYGDVVPLSAVIDYLNAVDIRTGE
jgi:maleamate amidohydrolase